MGLGLRDLAAGDQRETGGGSHPTQGLALQIADVVPGVCGTNQRRIVLRPASSNSLVQNTSVIPSVTFCGLENFVGKIP